MRLAWATDVHFDHPGSPGVDELCGQLQDLRAEALLLGGDIANATETMDHLAALRDRAGMPVYFVLGNHDYYGGAIAAVQARCRHLTAPPLCWLPAAGWILLDEGLGLVGHGGWGDARHGDFDEAPLLTDYLAIVELFEAAGRDNLLDGFEVRDPLRRKLGQLGDEAAATLRPALAAAAAACRQVIVLMHVPPFLEAAWYDGELSPPSWQPVVTCKAVGDLLQEAAAEHPACRFTVLCGHTHGGGHAEILPNLTAFTSPSSYFAGAMSTVTWDGTRLSIDLP